MKPFVSWTPKTAVERAFGAATLVIVACGPLLFNDYWVSALLTQAFIFGIVAASLIFLTAYGGMISLAQTALMGISGYIVGNMVTERVPGGETKGLTVGMDPNLAVVLAIAITTLIGVLMGAVAARAAGIYFLMLTLTYAVIANAFFGQVVQFGGFSPIAGINQDQYMPVFVGNVLGHPDKLYYITFHRPWLRQGIRLLRLFGRDPRRWGRNRDIDLVQIAQSEFPVHARIDIRPVADRKQRASACHASQQMPRQGFVGRWLMRLSDAEEVYMRAYPEASPGLRERDLFEGVG